MEITYSNQILIGVNRATKLRKQSFGHSATPSDQFLHLTIFFKIFYSSHHQAHPNHEDEVILRRKLREKVELEDSNSEDAPIVPVLR